MARFSQFKLILKDLPLGKTEYEYDLDGSYFKLMNDEESDVKRGKLAAALIVTRSETSFELRFDIKGAVQVPCDRCLDDVSMEVDTQQKIIVKFGEEYSEESDEIVVVPADEGEINVAWFIYEFIILSLPMKHVHPSGQCNKIVSSKLRKHKATLPDDESDDEFDDSDSDMDDAGDGGGGSTDPRWDALKDLETE